MPLNGWAWFTDGSAKLKLDGVHWTQPQCQQCRTRNGNDHSSQWAKFKAILVALVNTLLDETYYIFTDCLLFSLSLGKLQIDRLKILLFEAMSDRCKSQLQMDSQNNQSP